eukprot:6213008-Pleurochrysis_carterae.AAC.2
MTLRTNHGSQLVTFPQCALGAPYQKFTTLLVIPGLAPRLSHLRALRCLHRSHEAQCGGTRSADGTWSSDAHSAYPPDLNYHIAQAIASLRRAPGIHTTSDGAGTAADAAATAPIVPPGLQPTEALHTFLTIRTRLRLRRQKPALQLPMNTPPEHPSAIAARISNARSDPTPYVRHDLKLCSSPDDNVDTMPHRMVSAGTAAPSPFHPLLLTPVPASRPWPTTRPAELPQSGPRSRTTRQMAAGPCWIGRNFRPVARSCALSGCTKGSAVGY